MAERQVQRHGHAVRARRAGAGGAVPGRRAGAGTVDPGVGSDLGGHLAGAVLEGGTAGAAVGAVDRGKVEGRAAGGKVHGACGERDQGLGVRLRAPGRDHEVCGDGAGGPRVLQQQVSAGPKPDLPVLLQWRCVHWEGEREGRAGERSVLLLVQQSLPEAQHRFWIPG